METDNRPTAVCLTWLRAARTLAANGRAPTLSKSSDECDRSFGMLMTMRWFILFLFLSTWPSVHADVPDEQTSVLDDPLNEQSAVEQRAVDESTDAKAADAAGDAAGSFNADSFEAGSPGAPNSIPTTESVAIVAPATPRDESRSLIDLANLQLSTREYPEAEKTLTRSIALIEQRADRYNSELVEPLTLLGDALKAEGEFERALDAYGRAVHVTRINEGLHTPSQVDVVYREAAALIEMGEPGKANARQEYAYEVLLRSFGAGSPDLIPGLYKLADWYRRTNNVFAARGLYEHAVRVLTRAYGENDPRIVPALRGVAETYRLERFPPNDAGTMGESVTITSSETGYQSAVQGAHSVNRFSDGEEALAHIVRIHQANPDAKIEDEALAILDLADWYLLFDKWSRAEPLYTHSRTLLRDEGGMAADEVAAYFSQPVPLYLPLPDAPPPPPPAMRGPRTEGFVEIGYTVDDRGIVGDLTTLASQPEGLLDFKVRRAMRLARFRPRFEGDAPVITSNLKFKHTYSYFPRADTTPPPPAQAAPDDAATPPAASPT